VVAGGAIGVLLGSIFGLPRGLTGAAEGTFTSVGIRTIEENNQGAGPPTSRRFPDTNLEKITDWLTKILVGVGLVEIKSAPAVLLAFRDELQPSSGEGRATFSVFMTV
jgi:hypothetical protein